MTIYKILLLSIYTLFKFQKVKREGKRKEKKENLYIFKSYSFHFFFLSKIYL